MRSPNSLRRLERLAMLRASAAVKFLPRDIVEASSAGGVYTVVAYILMVVVFSCEVRSFLSNTFSTYLLMDMQHNSLLQINFDIDFWDIECRNLRVVVYVQGTEEAQLSAAASSDFVLRAMDAKGRAFGMPFRPEDLDKWKTPAEEASEHERKVKQLEKLDGKAELDADWLSSHDGFRHKSFQHVIQAHDFTVINFFAEWCGHCRDFAPEWDRIALRVNGNATDEAGNAKSPNLPVLPAMKFPDRDNVERGVRLIKMNCVDFDAICHEKGIDAFPTIRLYKGDGSFSVFEGRRDEVEIIRWVERTVKMKSYGWAQDHEAFERGCNAKGRMQVLRVPGHLHLMAGGGDQTLNPRMTNVSHTVKHLSFSDPDDGQYHRKAWAAMPHDVLNHVSPIDGQHFITNEFHEAYVHDMKVISTVSSRKTAYQFSHQLRLSKLPDHVIPQAQFYYDVEPFSIHIKRDEKRWYDFATSLFAMTGGTFVIMRLSSVVSRSALGSLHAALKASVTQRSARAGAFTVGHLD